MSQLRTVQRVAAAPQPSAATASAAAGFTDLGLTLDANSTDGLAVALAPASAEPKVLEPVAKVVKPKVLVARKAAAERTGPPPKPRPLAIARPHYTEEARRARVEGRVRLELSQRIDGGVGRYRLFDFDQTHVLTVLASYDLGAGFEVGARFRDAAGYPRTPVLDAVYDSRTDTYQPVFGAKNTLRIPAYYAFDVRVNVTDHRNSEEIVYNYNYSQRSYITGLPILPVLGAKLVW